MRNPPRRGTTPAWKPFVFFFALITIPWAFYVSFQPPPTTTTTSSSTQTSPTYHTDTLIIPNRQQPVLGPLPINGTKPTYGKHTGGDAIFALACKYPESYYRRFVGSVRKFGFKDDIVLAVSPPDQMKPGVKDYVIKTDVVAYAFEVDCDGPDNCKLKKDFLGYEDPRPMRTFANIRYALYEYWLQYYNDQSYILILDFRDTFFQASPFAMLPPIQERTPKYELMVFAENWKVKTIGTCKYNSLWVARCFGKAALPPIKDQAVICSGSTMGSYRAINYYVRTMLHSMDTVQCWKKGIESDQGYQNYLFYNGHFNTPEGNATLFYQVGLCAMYLLSDSTQGTGPVNTIGAMNGFRVPKHMKGPLDTFWKIRDSEGFILNNDGTRSACVHQWDRFYNEIARWLDNVVKDA